jgi:beta-1,4-mannosyl-glycoprotein beta-1,4-N-acetylglucosaminyltransferase
MKIIDTTTYFEEELMMDLRFNILNPYVDKFIVCESTFTHSGNKKKINFDKKKYPKFKDKIIHLVLENEPDDLIKKDHLDTIEKRFNSILRIKHQRNYIVKALEEFSINDLVIYSDNDEIPNLENIDLKNVKKKFLIFNQKLFYYKLDLVVPKLSWFGSKACKLKYLKSIDNLRNIKNKKYSLFRFDTYFSDIKNVSVKIVNNGGWHFSNLKSAKQLEKKYLNDENHAEYELKDTSYETIKDNILRKVVPYNYEVDKSSNQRFNETKLDNIDLNYLPKYINNNIEKYKEWFS